MRACPLSLFLALSLLGMGEVLAQAPAAADFHARVLSLYSFHPHTLDSKAIDEKSGELDKFWSEAQANKERVLPLLRQELADASSPKFFFYDGARLLLKMSDDAADRALALRAMPKVDLQDIQGTDYLVTVHWLASKGPASGARKGDAAPDQRRGAA